MTLLTSPTSETRVSLRRIVTAAGLLLVSGGLVIDHVSLSHLTRETQGSAQSSEVHALWSELSVVKQQLASIASRPNPASQVDFAAARRTLSERMDKVERVLGEAVKTNDLMPFQTRLEHLEARLDKARQTPLPTSVSVRRRAIGASKPKVFEPPFTLLDTELRGGETFLSIAPVGSRSLAQIHILHPGESEGDWQLEALDGKTATFRVDGQLHQVTVP